MGPQRNVGVTTPCPMCGVPFTPRGRPQVCSAACRQARFRRRHAVSVPTLPRWGARAATIHECPSCETRYLGGQRCPACRIFGRKLGPGGACPHCDEPILLADLLPGTEGGEAVS